MMKELAKLIRKWFGTYGVDELIKELKQVKKDEAEKESKNRPIECK